MQPVRRVAAAALLAASASASASGSPVAKVLDLLSKLEAKVADEGREAERAHEELSAWCKDGSKNLAFEIQTAKGEIEDLKASIQEQQGISASLSTKLDDLAASIAADEADLKSATKIRAEEAAEFAKEEKELVETIDTLERAVGILEREMQKGGASALQLKNAGTLASAMSVLVQASALSSADATRLTSLVQSEQSAEDAADDAELGAPAAALYEGHSRSIIDTLEDLHAKAQEQLDDARKKEATSSHNFAMLEQNLNDQMKFNSKDADETRKTIGTSAEKKAAAEGDLSVTEKDLQEDTRALAQMERDCVVKSEDFEAAKKSRSEELEALKGAKKAIAEATAASDDLTYGLNQISFVQLSRSNVASKSDLVNGEAVRLIRDLARKQHAPELAQLASRMVAAMRVHSKASADPFVKVRSLITDMIERLENDARGDASHEAYCKKELAESQTKRGELDHDITKVSTKIDSMTARSAQLKQQTADLQKSLAELTSSQAEATKMRAEEKTLFAKNKADMEQGIEGVKLALKILREYYSKGDQAHSVAEGASTSIVGLLEVVESDFTKGLAEMVAAEESAEVSYQQTSQENRVVQATREKDVKYKAKEAADLDRAVAEATSDRQGLQAEADAVAEYLAKLNEMCVAKPETYEARAARRTAELNGLREALRILAAEADAPALLQRTSSLRGVTAHVRA